MDQRLKTILPRILNRLGYFKDRIYIGSVKLHKRKWKIPVIDFIGYSHIIGTEIEGWIFQLMKRIHEKEKIDYYIDIGVNTGQSLIKIKSIDKDIPYLGFEPNPNCVLYVDYLIRLNNLTNARTICLGLGNSESLLKLNFGGMGDTRATLIEEVEWRNDLIYSKEIPIFQFDTLKFQFNGCQNILLKVDVEGYEAEVLKGAMTFLKTYLPLIIFEVLPHFQDNNIIQRQESIYRLLKDLNYFIFQISRDHKLEEIAGAFQNEKDYTKTDFIAVPEYRYAWIKELNLATPPIKHG